jgi:hypothetical protein
VKHRDTNLSASITFRGIENSIVAGAAAAAAAVFAFIAIFDTTSTLSKPAEIIKKHYLTKYEF